MLYYVRNITNYRFNFEICNANFSSTHKVSFTSGKLIMAKVLNLAAAIKYYYPELKHGDILFADCNKYVWHDNSSTLVPLDYHLDPFGHLPPIFTLNDFPDPRHFDNLDTMSVGGNNIRWLSLADGLIKSIVRSAPTQGSSYFIVENSGYKYKILVPDCYSTINSPVALATAFKQDVRFNHYNSQVLLALEKANKFYDVDDDIYMIYEASDLYASYAPHLK